MYVHLICGSAAAVGLDLLLGFCFTSPACCNPQQVKINMGDEEMKKLQFKSNWKENVTEQFLMRSMNEWLFPHVQIPGKCACVI